MTNNSEHVFARFLSCLKSTTINITAASAQTGAAWLQRGAAEKEQTSRRRSEASSPEKDSKPWLTRHCFLPLQAPQWAAPSGRGGAWREGSLFLRAPLPLHKQTRPRRHANVPKEKHCLGEKWKVWRPWSGFLEDCAASQRSPGMESDSPAASPAWGNRCCVPGECGPSATWRVGGTNASKSESLTAEGASELQVPLAPTLPSMAGSPSHSGEMSSAWSCLLPEIKEGDGGKESGGVH